ncbi:winged helix-turn-helix domain-containing protein [Halosimplex amylolyticum]|uniref:winged helix-turn-helix domain-containing protein n=1 Tax=Halosimplex amylolyticum TaxID=3396616 RepID=UPI003F550B5A
MDGPAGSVTATLAALADDTRREILHYLIYESDGVASYEELARQVQSQESDQELERSVALLHHQHLPKLSDADLVEYDARSSTVRYHGDPLTETVLATIEDE